VLRLPSPHLGEGLGVRASSDFIEFLFLAHPQPLNHGLEVVEDLVVGEADDGDAVGF
jgi:hypothetical protein